MAIKNFGKVPPYRISSTGTAAQFISGPELRYIVDAAAGSFPLFSRQLFTALLRITVHLFLVPSRTELISAPSMTRYMQMYSQNIPMARVVRLPYMENPL